MCIRDRYWSVTVSALGYKDYTYKFHADKENIAQHVVIASDSDEVKALQSTIKTADSYLEKETEYCAKPYSDFKTEYKEAQDALKHDTLYKANKMCIRDRIYCHLHLGI